MGWSSIDYTEMQRLKESSNKEVEAMVANAHLILRATEVVSVMSNKETTATLRYLARCVLALATTLSSTLECIDRAVGVTNNE